MLYLSEHGTEMVARHSGGVRFFLGYGIPTQAALSLSASACPVCLRRVMLHTSNLSLKDFPMHFIRLLSVSASVCVAQSSDTRISTRNIPLTTQKTAPANQFGTVTSEVLMRAFRSISHANRVLSGFRPQVYFRPQEVWEIRGAE